MKTLVSSFHGKLHLFLWDRLNLSLSSQYKSKFRAKIIEDCERNLFKAEKTKYRFLVFNEKSSNKGWLELAQITLHVLRLRGATRSLLMSCRAIPGFNDYYQFSRVRLMKMILKNYGLIKSNLLSRLSFDFLTYEEYERHKKLSVLKYNNLIQIQELQEASVFLIEKNSNQRFVFLRRVRSEGTSSLIDELVCWNSRITINFIKAHNLHDIVGDFLFSEYFLVYRELFEFVEVEFIDHKFADYSLDYVYQEYGENYFEVFKCVEIFHQRFVFFENSIINYDATLSPTQKFTAGVWNFVHKVPKSRDRFEVRISREQSVILDKAIYLMGPRDENWFHFLLDTMPRLLFFENVPVDVPILVRSDIPSTSKEFLAMVTERELIEVHPSESVQVHNLYVCPGRSVAFDSKPPRNLQWIEFSPVVLSKLKDVVFRVFDLNSTLPGSNQVTLERKSTTRNIVNWKKIESACHEFGLSVHSLDEHFFRNQIRFFFDASLIVSPGGAALANIIFMRPGTTVVVLHSYNGRFLNLWKKLAMEFNIEFREVQGLPLYFGFNWVRWMHSNFYVSVKKLRRTLSIEI